jgi:uncharacterized repeat protein (TIGR03803 family)
MSSLNPGATDLSFERHAMALRAPLRWAFGIGAAVALAGCGGSPPPIGAPGAMPQSNIAEAADRARALQYRVVFSFGEYKGGRHGRAPLAPLVYVNGTFYGTTAYGGDRDGYGVVFGVTPNGKIKVPHIFTAGPGGNEPYGALTLVHGKLYGTTYEGGTYGYGAIFRLSTTHEYRTLYSFNFTNPSMGSGGPVGRLIDVNGTLYGTTDAGGASDYGTVYSVSTRGNVNILHYFSGSEGANPAAGLLNVNGTLYGTTWGGGAYKNGAVFRISTTGAEKVLFSFDGTDGAHPAAPLIPVNGKLYGTTQYGGSARLGTVFSMTMRGNEETVLHSFSNENGDGAHPEAGLIDVNGTLYGTTAFGGVFTSTAECHAYGCGIIFSVTTGGKETVVHRFQQNYESDGSVPMANLIEVNGRLYGTTEYGGYSTPKCNPYPCYYGTVFEFRPT